MKTLADMEQKAAALKIKQERAAEAAEALREYEAEKANLVDNIARLRALRLEHEAQQQQQATADKAALKATLLANKAATQKSTTAAKLEPDDQPAEIKPIAPAKKTATAKKAG